MQSPRLTQIYRITVGVQEACISDEFYFYPTGGEYLHLTYLLHKSLLRASQLCSTVLDSRYYTNRQRFSLTGGKVGMMDREDAIT